MNVAAYVTGAIGHLRDPPYSVIVVSTASAVRGNNAATIRSSARKAAVIFGRDPMVLICLEGSDPKEAYTIGSPAE